MIASPAIPNDYLLLYTGLVTALPFHHMIIAGSPDADPFLWMSGSSINSTEENLDVKIQADGQLVIGVPSDSQNTFEEPLEVTLR